MQRETSKRYRTFGVFAVFTDGELAEFVHKVFERIVAEGEMFLAGDLNQLTHVNVISDAQRHDLDT